MNRQPLDGNQPPIVRQRIDLYCSREINQERIVRGGGVSGIDETEYSGSAGCAEIGICTGHCAIRTGAERTKIATRTTFSRCLLHAPISHIRIEPACEPIPQFAIVW